MRDSEKNSKARLGRGRGRYNFACGGGGGGIGGGGSSSPIFTVFLDFSLLSSRICVVNGRGRGADYLTW